jgi:chromosome segregation ATPase
LKEKAKNNEDLQKKLSAVSGDYDEICEKLVHSQNTIDEYSRRESELKALFEVTAVKVDELKAKADHYHKVSKDYKKKIKYFENEIVSYEQSLAEAEAKVKESTNKILEIESIRVQEKEKVEDGDMLVSVTKAKEIEDACLLFKGLYEDAVRENERWVVKIKQQDEAIQMVEAEKNMLEGTIFDMEVTISKLEKDLEEANSVKLELMNMTSALDKAKKKIKDLKTGLVTIANANDDTNTANSTLLNQIISLQETIDIKEEQINTLNYQLKLVTEREEEIAQGFLMREEEIKDLEISLKNAEDRVESLENELDCILMEKLSSSANSTTKNTPSSSFSATVDFSSPNPFATPYNNRNISNPSTNDDNNSTTSDRFTVHPDDNKDIDETLTLVNEAEDAFKSGSLYLAVEKYKHAGLKGIQSIKNDEDADIDTKRQLKELVKICLTNAESINDKISTDKGTDDNDIKKVISNNNSMNKIYSQQLESRKVKLESDNSKLDWVDSLIKITIIGTIVMVAIFFALIAHFELTRPPLGPKYIWPEDDEY